MFGDKQAAVRSKQDAGRLTQWVAGGKIVNEIARPAVVAEHALSARAPNAERTDIQVPVRCECEAHRPVQFVATGNASLGLVALSQMKQRPGARFWTVPATLHDPIRQDAVLLRRGRDNVAATEFLRFLRGDAARSILESFGYERGDAR